MHIYLYISVALFFIAIPMLFALLLRAIYNQKNQAGIHIRYIVSTYICYQFCIFCKGFHGGFLNEECQSNIQ